MKIGLIGTKEGMTQIFTKDGTRVPVTILKVDKNFIVAKKEYNDCTSIQLGYNETRKKLLSKAEIGHLSKFNIAPLKTLREFKINQTDISLFKEGESIGLSLFNGVESVDVSGISKGKGFAGVMKRHNFRGFPRTHGTHEYFRHGGSIGCCALPGKVFKGRKMPGRLGNERTTVKNLKVLQILSEENLIIVKGSVPGARGKVVEIKPVAYLK